MSLSLFGIHNAESVHLPTSKSIALYYAQASRLTALSISLQRVGLALKKRFYDLPAIIPDKFTHGLAVICQLPNDNLFYLQTVFQVCPSTSRKPQRLAACRAVSPAPERA